MDILLEDSREDKLIEEYLFSGYKASSNSTFDKDQQFAKPIEDEDLFGGIEGGDSCSDETALKEANDEAELSFGDDIVGGSDPVEDLSGHSESEILSYSNLFDNSEKVPSGGLHEDSEKTPPTNHNDGEDEISDVDKDQPFEEERELQTVVDENACPVACDREGSPSEVHQAPNATYSKPKALTPVQVRKKLFKERLLEQARTMAIKPRRLGTGFGTEDRIEVTIEQHRLVSDTNTKFIFNKLFNKSKKAVDSSGTPERERRSWDSYKDSLRKRICSQKRKIWDSFQQPTDGYNDEEELIEQSIGEDLETTAKHDEDPDMDDGDRQSEIIDDEQRSDNEDDMNEDGDVEDVQQDASSDDEDDEAVVRRKNIIRVPDDEDEISEQAPDVILQEAEEAEELPQKKVSNIIKNRGRCRLTFEDEDGEDELNAPSALLRFSDDEEERPTKKRRKQIVNDDEVAEENEEDILFG